MSILRRLQGRKRTAKVMGPLITKPHLLQTFQPDESQQQIPAPAGQGTYLDLKVRVQNKLLSTIDTSVDVQRLPKFAGPFKNCLSKS
jgi:hypothetical protein